MANNIEIYLRGEEVSRVSSIRLRCETWDALDTIARKTNRSRNEIISIILEYCIENAIITEGNK